MPKSIQAAGSNEVHYLHQFGLLLSGQHVNCSIVTPSFEVTKIEMLVDPAVDLPASGWAIPWTEGGKKKVL